jgi:uncharacterized membrane protein
MNPAHLHLLLNHSPIIGTIVALGLFVMALMRNQDELKQVSLVLFVLIALLAIPAFMSGYAAQEAIKDLPDVSMAMIQTHQGTALLALLLMEITGAAALVGLWRFGRVKEKPWMSSAARTNLYAVLLLSMATVGLMAVTGTTGGDIRHPEIMSGPETPTILGTLGERIIPAFQYVVVDYSMWVWPILEDLHFLGLILLLGSILVLNLRVLGFLKQLPVAPLQRFIPWGIAGFILNIITGFLFFMGMPGFYIVNAVFQIKMLTIMIAGANLILFYCTSAFQTLEVVGPGEDAPRFAKFIAVSAIVLWIAVIVLGRYIPYGEVT